MSDPEFFDRQKQADSFRPSEPNRPDLNRPIDLSNPRAHNHQAIQDSNDEMMSELTYLLKSFHNVMKHAKRFFGKYLTPQENHFHSSPNQPSSYEYPPQQQTISHQKFYGQVYCNVEFQPRPQEKYEKQEYEPYQNSAPVKQRKNGWGKKNKASEDPNKPKAPLTPYFLFFSETRDMLREKYPDKSLSEIGSLGGQIWRKFSEAEKQVYRDRYEEAKEKYRYELTVYHSSGGISNGRTEYGETTNADDF